MAEDIPTPSSVAMFENGESRGETHYFLEKQQDDSFIGVGDDNLYNYQMRINEMPFNGSLFVRNKKTGEIKPIPTEKLMQISRLSKISQEETVSKAGVQDLVKSFGTRAAQRIMKLRSNTSK